MDVLVLDASFQPAMRVPWERAFKMIYEGVVEVIEETTKVKHTVNTEWRVPSILRFTTVALGKRRVRFSRLSIYNRDRGRCQYCGKFCSLRAFELEHVFPQSRGGLTTWENTVTACTACNQKKTNRTPQEAGMTLIRKPVKPKTLSFMYTWKQGMPESWRSYMRDATYWEGELQHD